MLTGNLWSRDRVRVDTGRNPSRTTVGEWTKSPRKRHRYLKQYSNSTKVGLHSTKVGVHIKKVGVHNTKVGVHIKKVGVHSTTVGVYRTVGKRYD